MPGTAEGTLQDMARALVEVANPEAIVLFGSCATGEDRPDADVDILVALPFQVTGSVIARLVQMMASVAGSSARLGRNLNPLGGTVQHLL